MLIQSQPKSYTPAEYLTLEAAAESKHEYCHGKIVPMTRGSTNHNEIAGNFYAHLKFALRQRPYKLFIGDVRLGVPGCRLFTYPGVMLIGGEPAFYPGRTDTVTNPQMIVEVLSKSTRNYDQGDKFDCYRTIPELQEYVLVDQYQIYIKQFVKTPEGHWLLKEYREVSQRLGLSTIDICLDMAEIYEGMRLES